MLVSGSVTACNQGHRMVKMGFPGIISLGFCVVLCLGYWDYNPLILTIPSSSSSLYIWNQGSSYLIYWQLGGWVQIYRELEDQGFTSIYIHSWDIFSYRFQLDTACVVNLGDLHNSLFFFDHFNSCFQGEGLCHSNFGRFS